MPHICGRMEPLVHHLGAWFVLAFLCTLATARGTDGASTVTDTAHAGAVSRVGHQLRSPVPTWVFKANFTTAVSASRPRPGAVDASGNLWAITDPTTGAIAKIDTTSGATLIAFNGTATLNTPNGLALSPDGQYLYVANTGNNNVKKYSVGPSALTYLLSWGEEGSAPGQFSSPYAVGVSPNGTIVYVLDMNNNRVQAFDTVGNPLFMFGSEDLNGPQGLAVNPVTGEVYVANTGGGNSKIFTAGGAIELTFAQGGIGEGICGTKTSFVLTVDYNQYPEIAGVYSSDTGAYMTMINFDQLILATTLACNLDGSYVYIGGLDLTTGDNQIYQYGPDPPSLPPPSPPPPPASAFVVEVKVLTTGAGINCSLWTLEAKAAYEQAMLSIANTTGNVVEITSFCLSAHGTVTSGRRMRSMLQEPPAGTVTLEIVHMLRVRGSVAAAQKVVDSTAAAVKNGQFAAAVQTNMGGSVAFKPVAPPNPNPSCIVGITCRKSPPPPPVKHAMVVADPHVYDFIGKKSEYKGTPGGTMSILTAGNGKTSIRQAWAAGRPTYGVGNGARASDGALPCSRHRACPAFSPSISPFSLTAKLARWAPKSTATIMTSVTFKALGATVFVTQVRAKPTAPYKLAAKVTAANGTSVALAFGTKHTRVTLPGGLIVSAPTATRIALATPLIQVSVIEGVMGDVTMGWLDSIIFVRGRLPAPVGGVLGPSYVAASKRAKAAGKGTAPVKASVVFVPPA
eukprot:scaffold12.g8066.t1